MQSFICFKNLSNNNFINPKKFKYFGKSRLRFTLHQNRLKYRTLYKLFIKKLSNLDLRLRNNFIWNKLR